LCIWKSICQLSCSDQRRAAELCFETSLAGLPLVPATPSRISCDNITLSGGSSSTHVFVKLRIWSGSWFSFGPLLGLSFWGSVTLALKEAAVLHANLRVIMTVGMGIFHSLPTTLGPLLYLCCRIIARRMSEVTYSLSVCRWLSGGHSNG